MSAHSKYVILRGRALELHVWRHQHLYVHHKERQCEQLSAEWGHELSGWETKPSTGAYCSASLAHLVASE